MTGESDSDEVLEHIWHAHFLPAAGWKNHRHQAFDLAMARLNISSSHARNAATAILVDNIPIV